MAIEVLMPALSPTMEDGTLAKWFVKEGDKVEPGDLLAEIETDKATMEFEAVEEGIIEKLLVAEGTEGVKVNSAIATLSGEDNSTRKNIEEPAASNTVITETSEINAKKIKNNSNSMVALCVSISARRTPGSALSPSFTNHFANVPSSMVGESAGIRTSIANFLSSHIYYFFDSTNNFSCSSQCKFF